MHVMIRNKSKGQTILVTGGTSGLGLQLVHLFLREGLNVVATGRQQINLQHSEGKFTLYKVDFGNLKQVADVIRRICSNHSISMVVNNAGILSPPKYTETTDGLEYTFQINFLAHLLINDIFLATINDDRRIRIATVTSPVYRLASSDPAILSGQSDYMAIRAYPSSKLYLAMICEFLSKRHSGLNMDCFSFDPGTFSSGIYRTQDWWFRVLYRIAAPFMRSPGKVAKVMVELMLEENVVNGMIYDKLKRRRSIPEIDKSQKSAFADTCYTLLDPFL